MSHPLENWRLRFRNFKGFGGDPGDEISFNPINVLVGRNNSGKSAIIDALNVVLTEGKSVKPDFRRQAAALLIEVGTNLTEAHVRSVFRENTGQGGVPGQNHWQYGSHFVGEPITKAYGEAWEATWVNGPDLSAISDQAREGYKRSLAVAAGLPQATLVRIAAERNVRPEVENNPTPVAPNGDGLTNLVRAFLHDSRYSMNEVEIGLRSDLNTIYDGDAFFKRIICRRDPTNTWEIYLEEDGGSAVRLSESGSSLKSIFIILATVRLNPIIDQKYSINNSVFCVEEPENNLHPALLRRLLDFLANSRLNSNSSLIITTHSAAAIDWATRREDTNTYHVRRKNGDSTVSFAKEYTALRYLIEDLDIRASEILQANGVIWVEGPSDRIYIRKWLNLLSEGTLIEGVHYSIMFYGGKLLSHLSSLPESDLSDAISLLRLNRNMALVMDSDRRMLKNGSFRSILNETKRRIIAEAEQVCGFVWTTAGKEIENYISKRLVKVVSNGSVTEVDQFSSVPDALKNWSKDKIMLAHAVTVPMQLEDLDVLDLNQKVIRLVEIVQRWNAA